MGRKGKGGDSLPPRLPQVAGTVLVLSAPNNSRNSRSEPGLKNFFIFFGRSAADSAIYDFGPISTRRGPEHAMEATACACVGGGGDRRQQLLCRRLFHSRPGRKSPRRLDPLRAGHDDLRFRRRRPGGPLLAVLDSGTVKQSAQRPSRFHGRRQYTWWLGQGGFRADVARANVKRARGLF